MGKELNTHIQESCDSTTRVYAGRIRGMRNTNLRYIFQVALAGLAFGMVGILCLTQSSSTLAAPQQKGTGLGSLTLLKTVPYVPTPQDVVEKMLDLAQVKPDDVVYDLGSGDGRIVITAAQKYGAHAVGIEIDPDLYRQSRDRIKELGLDSRAQVMCEDMYQVSVHRATVVTLYLLTSFNDRLRPKLDRELRSGTRIVCHDFHVPGWEPVQVVDVTSKNDVPHKLYLYVHP
jgi:SAM-dependent methyltransferase